MQQKSERGLAVRSNAGRDASTALSAGACATKSEIVGGCSPRYRAFVLIRVDSR